MKVLVVGQGGREHAIAWRLAFSPGVQVLITRGNPGTDAVATPVPIAPLDVEGLVEFARRERVDLVVVGPEAPLAAGLVDRLEQAGVRAFGPVQAAAQIEASKAFAHDVMQAAGVPCARAEVFDDVEAALRFIGSTRAPMVVKADGLAAGKGVVVAQDPGEAREAVLDLMVRGTAGDAGRRVVIEERLAGEEVSFMALCDGETVRPLAAAKDHKRVHDGDQGPNTGGMGACSARSTLDAETERLVLGTIIRPTLEELARRGVVYRGVLYAGLMRTAQGPRVLEFNCRFGDPEAQAVLVRWEGDFLDALLACAERRLRDVQPTFMAGAAVCVVLAAQGYPGAVRTGDLISGLDEAGRLPQVVVFHAGTARGEDGLVRTAGGRVLGVTAWGTDLDAARRRAYEAVSCISWRGMHHRTDIGASRGASR